MQGKNCRQQHSIMSAVNTWLVFFGIIALQSAFGHRFIRSPDKMEIDVPHRDRDSEEFRETMGNEAEYWHGQGNSNGDAGHGHMDREKEKNEETYDQEKEHHHNNQQDNQKEINQTYQSDKDKVESHQDDNQAHLSEHHNNEIDEEKLPNMETDAGDRYEDKGNEYKEDSVDKMENYEPGHNNPSFTYTRD